MKTLPKSLHTVTVLVNVARHLQSQQELNAAAAVAQASTLLGYGLAANDPYDLEGRAIKELSK